MLRLILIIFIFIISSPDSFSADKATLAYADHEAFPYYLGHSLKIADPPGLSIEIISQAADNIGLKIEFVRYPGKRVLNYVKNGEVDGGILFSFNRDRAKYSVYPMLNNMPVKEKRLATLSYFLYKLKNSGLEWDGEKITCSGCEGDIRNSVAANLGFSIVKNLKQHRLHVIEKKKTPHLFELLKEKRVVAVAAQSIIADRYLETAGISNVEKIKLPFRSKDYYLIFSPNFTKNNPDIPEKLWTQISIIREPLSETLISKYPE